MAYFRLLPSLALVLGLAGCGGSNTTAPSAPLRVPDPVIELRSLVVSGMAPAIGASVPFSAVGYVTGGSYGSVAMTTLVTWSSARPDVASVTPDGVVTGKSAGETSITATYGKTAGSLNLKVEPSFGSYSVRGLVNAVVTRDSTQPLAHVTVTVTDSTGTKRSAATDLNGNYLVSGVAPGAASVMVLARDYLFVPYPLMVKGDEFIGFTLSPIKPCPSITFEELDRKSATFTSSSRCGFTVTAVTPNWNTSEAIGNLEPSIGYLALSNDPTVGEVSVVRPGGQFSFRSLQINSGTAVTYLITGTLGETRVLSLEGVTTASGTDTFETIVNPASGTRVDRLLIRLTSPARVANFVFLDNIVVDY